MPTPRHFELVLLALQRVKSVEAARIAEGSLLKKDLNFDSIAILDLFFEIEQETGLRISAMEISQFVTAGKNLVTFDFSVGDLVRYLDTQTPG